jgi:hypothetical protein
MESLLTSSTPDRFAMRRHLRRDEKSPVSHRYQYVLALHLSGKKATEIMALTKYSSATVYKILSDPAVIAMRQQLLNHTAKEFEALFPKVVDGIRACLDSGDPKTVLDAADKWLKAHGKYQKSEGTQINITAEDIVMNILNQAPQQVMIEAGANG